MSTLETLPTKDLTAFHDQIQSRYDDFKKRGLKLDLTRGKPSSEQLDLSNGLLGLPGADDFLAFDKTDTRNYGVLQGSPSCAPCWRRSLASRRHRSSSATTRAWRSCTTR